MAWGVVKKKKTLKQKIMEIWWLFMSFANIFFHVWAQFVPWKKNNQNVEQKMIEYAERSTACEWVSNESNL